MRAGVGDSTRYVPLHTLFGCIGRPLCAVLPAIHSFTGCDITSTVGTKKAALEAEGEKLLKQFGTTPTLSPSIIRGAEYYLVKVLKSSSDSKNFDDLRSEMFHHTKEAPTTTYHQPAEVSCHISSVVFTIHIPVYMLSSHKRLCH